MTYKIVLVKQAEKDLAKIKAAPALLKKVKNLLMLMVENPFETPPSYEKLQGDLQGFYSRRINKQHRLVYEVLSGQRIIKIARMWTHYGN
ncbi:MAG: Txe/YoeB family addiction module toxin [Candidatus Margulisbacteria bacterium]|jgi:Txe/YoeB family toxin of toxin-antitoxin system|nr:Txe/YoeB family addiction module toxin [Candidatus Margulisiibacteriota bacterium]